MKINKDNLCYYIGHKDITLYKSKFEDIIEEIMNNDKIDMILTDLPYGILKKCKWDTPVDLNFMWDVIENNLWKKNPKVPVLLFSQMPFTAVLGASNLKHLKYEIIWEKTQATGHLNAYRMPMKAHENILVFYKKLPVYNPQKTQGHKPINSYTKYIETQNNTVLYGKMNREISGGGETDRFPRSILTYASDKQKEHLHPTQKPVALLEELIKTYTNEGDTVLDFTAGVFSTAIACINTNRKFIGIEMEEDYFLKGVKRIEDKLEEIKNDRFDK